MKNYLNNLFLLFCFLLCTPSYSQTADEQPERVSFSPENPRSGEKIKISYNPLNGDLEYSDEVKIILYLLRDGDWDVEQRAMIKKNDKWELIFTLPVNSSFLILKFIQGDMFAPDISDNNNDKGYYFSLLNSLGKPQYGNTIGLAILKAPSASGGVLNRYYTVTPSIKKEEIKELLSKGEAATNSDKTNYLIPYLNLQKIILEEDFEKYSKDFVNKELSSTDLSEKYLEDLYSFYFFTQRDSILGGEIGNHILTKYPRSNTARFVSYARIEAMHSDMYKNISSIEDFLQRYPISQWRKNPDKRGYIYYSLFRVLGSAYFDTRQFDKFTDLYADLDFKTGNELARWNVFRAYMFNSVSKDILYQINSKVMSYLLASKNDNSFSEDFTSKDAAQKNATQQLDDRLFTHISLLYDLGKYEEARKFFFDLSPDGKYATADLNQINLHVIEKLNLKNEVQSHIEMCVKYNAVTPEMINKLKNIYLSSHKNNEEGFDTYITSLKSDEEKVKMKEYVKSHMVNYPMPDFALESADGGLVSSNDLRDKIVLIDFWATWCRPCIMAFPGMQLVTDKFAEDPYVQIYLVGTMQTGDYRSKSVDFVKKSGYRFNLLHDSINPKTGEQDLLFRNLAPFFNSSGIPRKIIIKNGIIRYSSEGYSGSPSKLLDEISLAIEILKSEK